MGYFFIGLTIFILYGLSISPSDLDPLLFGVIMGLPFLIFLHG